MPIPNKNPVLFSKGHHRNHDAVLVYQNPLPNRTIFEEIHSHSIPLSGCIQGPDLLILIHLVQYIVEFVLRIH